MSNSAFERLQKAKTAWKNQVSGMAVPVVYEPLMVDGAVFPPTVAEIKDIAKFKGLANQDGDLDTDILVGLVMATLKTHDREPYFGNSDDTRRDLRAMPFMYLSKLAMLCANASTGFIQGIAAITESAEGVETGN